MSRNSANYFFHQCQGNDKKYENYLSKEKYQICCTSHSLIVHQKLITSENRHGLKTVQILLFKDQR